MKLRHRAVLGAAFGILAGAGLAPSAGFACHPISQLVLGLASGEPGSALIVEGNGFDPGLDMEVHWNSDDGNLLGAGQVEAVDFTGHRAQVSVHVTVPRDAAVGVDYTIVGIQIRPNGTPLRAVKQFSVVAAPAGPVQAVPPIEQVRPVPPGRPADRPTGATPAKPGAQAPPAVLPVVAATQPAGALPPPSAGARAAEPGRPATVEPAGAPSGRPGAGLLSPAAGPERASTTDAVLPAAAAAPPAPTDLWSGLGTGRASGLLDPSGPVPRRDGAPIGAALLASGVVAMAGVALAAERRRLALAGRRAPAR